LGKYEKKFLLIAKNYNGYDLITKEGRIFESLLCLKMGSSCGDGE